MTDKEFKRLKRIDLINIIYEYQKKQDELIAENDELKEKLRSKDLRIENAGSIAEAVASLNRLFETAQSTADDYVEQVKRASDKKAEEIIAEAEKKAQEIISEAEKKDQSRKAE